MDFASGSVLTEEDLDDSAIQVFHAAQESKDVVNDTITLDTSSSGEVYNLLDKFIDPDQVENMCKEYPALSKVWRNFKSVYDMTLQDYKGKKDEGALI